MLKFITAHLTSFQTSAQSPMLATELWKALRLYGSNEVRDGALDNRLDPKTEQGGDVASAYGPSQAQRLQLCSHCSGAEGGPHFPGAQDIFFSFTERRQHFLSQSNFSLCLTRLPAIFTQLKLQMIYFQLHYSPALWHMVLSITANRTEPPEQ